MRMLLYALKILDCCLKLSFVFQKKKNFNLNKALFKANEAKTKVAIKILYDINFNVEQIGNYC